MVLSGMAWRDGAWLRRPGARKAAGESFVELACGVGFSPLVAI
jgi:hypothetical protein